MALEPNADRVSTGFLSRVLGRAIPAGVVIALATVAVFQLVQLDDAIDADHARSVAVLVAGSVALINLARVARPLSLLRKVLVIAMVSLFALAFLMPWTRDLFELPVTEAWAYGLAAVFVVVAYPLLVLGSRVAEHIRVSRIG
jgi:cation-transporting ATPase E